MNFPVDVEVPAVEEDELVIDVEFDDTLMKIYKYNDGCRLTMPLEVLQAVDRATKNIDELPSGVIVFPNPSNDLPKKIRHELYKCGAVMAKIELDGQIILVIRKAGRVNKDVMVKSA